jgi:hypothetical protein
MKLLIHFFLTFFFLFSIQAEDLGVCQLMASDYGNGMGDDLVPNECFELVKKKISIESENFEVYGHEKIIYVVDKRKKEDEKGRVQLLAGEYSTLKDLKKMAIDDKNEELFIYDYGSLSIKVFNLKILGNVSPIREIKSQYTRDISEIKIDSKEEKVGLVQEGDESIIHYSRLANIHQHQSKRFMTIIE